MVGAILIEQDKQKAIAKLSQLAQQAEDGFQPNDNFEKMLEKEKAESWKHGGRTVDGFSKKIPTQEAGKDGQLKLFGD
ncbi:MAG: hypothetical protein H6577_02050 [Lewinellaceae bacterium]|nr:hypothetical protein [Saprospiraceae bacterium]MCB9336890.1 hypothetical protein [Lewinellaceae bacterium]